MIRSGVMVIVVLASVGMASAAPTTEAGMKVFADNKCGICHAVAGKGNVKGALDGVGVKLSAAEIREWLVNAPEMAVKAKAARKPAMKSFAQLPKDEIDALVTYLSTLKGK